MFALQIKPMFYLARFIFFIKGWKVKGAIPEAMKKCVIIQAPHTSMRDFFVGWLASKIMKVKFRFMIKKEAFIFPLAGIIKSMGGIPVDRSRSQGTVKQIVDVFNNAETLFLIITPEGTRRYTDKWKKGFYYIAQQAKVPVLLGFIDYKNKICGIGGQLQPSGNFKEDFKIIENFYRGMPARYPEKFNLT